MMDNKQIILNKAKSKTSLNDNSFLDVSFKNNKKLLSSTDASALVNQYELYNEERKNSEIIRLTCTINPLCSNILHNKVTEIVINEGSDNAQCVNFQGKNWEYVRQNNASSASNITYHCGIDIFNNHFFRSSTFKCVEVNGGLSSNNADYFNTLFDYVRNYNGEKKKYYKDNTGGIDINLVNNYLHLYTKDDVENFPTTVQDKIIEKNGWFGFTNETRMASSVNVGKSINRPILNKNACQFIDFYPERDLFYFTPKYNSYRHREEKNWNYCLTYPYSSTTENLPFIRETQNSSEETVGMLVIQSITYNKTNSYGVNSIRIISLCKHGLVKDDIINVYKVQSSTVKTNMYDGLIVNEVIDDYTFYVTQYSDDSKTINYKDNSLANKVYSFCRVENGIECNYYVRLFKRLPNWKSSNIKPTEYNIYRDDILYETDISKKTVTTTNTTGKNLVDCYNDLEHDFESHNGKLAYANNIYNDDISEIVYTDDIDVSNLKDNLNRPLTEIYLTILKNNAGYKEFYSGSTGAKAEVVEYSHCFGPLTHSFKMFSGSPVEACNVLNCTYSDNNQMYNSNGLEYPENDNRWGNEVLYSSDTVFYGDIVCFSPSAFEEQVLDESYFRFNTVQRELGSPFYEKYYTSSDSAVNKKASINFKYKDGQSLKLKNDGTNKIDANPFTTIYSDELISDDYDVKLPSNSTSTAFYASGTVETNKCEFYEGYYYKSHYKIPFRTFSNTVSTQQAKVYSSYQALSIDVNTMLIKTREYTYLEPHDIVIIAVPSNGKYIRVKVEKIINRQTFIINGENIKNTLNDLKAFKVIKPDTTIPQYALLLKDGSYNYVWREVIANGYDNDSDIETYPFTNGAFYINLPINFYLLRQGISLSQENSIYSDFDTNTPTTLENKYVTEDNILC